MGNYIRVKVVAGVMMHREGKFLLVQHNRGKGEGMWNWPGGHVDNGESIPQAARRESREETGHRVRLGRKIGIFHPSAAESVRHLFEGTVTGGTLRPQPGEIRDARWFSYRQLLNLNRQRLLRNEWVLQAAKAFKRARR